MSSRLSGDMYLRSTCILRSANGSGHLPVRRCSRSLGLFPYGCVCCRRQRHRRLSFLTGMMVLAELAQRERSLTGSPVRPSEPPRDPFPAVRPRVRRRDHRDYRAFQRCDRGRIDAAVVVAVVLTPAVAAAVPKAKADPISYLFACVFIANAANLCCRPPIWRTSSFSQRICPALPSWLGAFGIASVFSIAATFVVLALISRRDLRGSVTSDVPQIEAQRAGF